MGAVSAVNEAAFRTPLGSLTDPIDTPKGLVILRPDERLPAPAEDWDLFRKTLNNGARVAAADVDRLPARGSVIAAVMYLASLRATSRSRAGRELPAVPPPFMIAALPSNDSSARHS